MRTPLAFLISIVLLSQVMGDKIADSCWKNAIGRGVGHPIHACPAGLENDASLCYVPCKEGYTGVGPVCWSKSHAPYGRGVGVPLGCSPTEEENASLCYKKCDSGFAGVGPVCWGECPVNYHQCGALCTPDTDSCTDELKTMVKDTIEAIALIVAKAVEGEAVSWEAILKALGKVGEDFTYAVCETPSIKRLLLDA